ncbi:STM4504/CBY_0614 family protein [Pseudoalteromonas shioyasakiensis]|uniref:STM4504/CBY_0614 family protein n=1 Tax=Pseudoalteromonas shioyasakiensis TaxID=1190813 RepID=UPI001C3C7CB2|nr:hypothetical protein [Pseudoalteromonas shioyasakiensis]
MGYKIYSKRQKELRGEVHDVYQYDLLPQSLRIQIKFLLDSLLGNESNYNYEPTVHGIYNQIYNDLREELGSFDLNNRNSKTEKYNTNAYAELNTFLINERNTELVLSYVEYAFRLAELLTEEYEHSKTQKSLKTLNLRFRENGVGFAFEEGHIIRIDSKLMHEEVIKPALKLLNMKEYEVTQDYFLNAYDHYRNKKYNEAIVECNKAFESTMKIICMNQNWELKGNETASKLIAACFKNKLIPDYWQTQLSSLNSMLCSGIPTIRNKYSHGQDALQEQAPEELVGYMLHTTASTIIFLIESQKRLH